MEGQVGVGGSFFRLRVKHNKKIEKKIDNDVDTWLELLHLVETCSAPSGRWVIDWNGTKSPYSPIGGQICRHGNMTEIEEAGGMAHAP